MEDHFFRIRRPLFAAYLFAALAVIVDGNLLGDEPIWHEGRYGHIALIILGGWAYFSTNRNAHRIIAIATLLTFLALIAIRFWDPR